MSTDKLRGILNAIFLIGAVASVILYFTVEDKTVFFWVCGGALFVKAMEFFIRFTN